MFPGATYEFDGEPSTGPQISSAETAAAEPASQLPTAAAE